MCVVNFLAAPSVARATYSPRISLPRNLTCSTCFWLTLVRNSEKEIRVPLVCNALENCQISARTTTRVIQKRRLLRVELTLYPS